MSLWGDGSRRGGERNPFPVIPVETLSPYGDPPRTVLTPACETVRDHAEKFLRSMSADGRAFPGAGNVLALCGENGSGKTHLAKLLCHGLLADGGSPVHLVHVDGMGNSFLDVYRRLVERVDPIALSDCAQGFYAGVVADSLAGSPAAEDVVAGLRQGRLSPQGVVLRHGLVRVGLLEELRRRLTAVTGNPAFGAALALYMRPEFKRLVLDWVNGAPPGAALAERGVTHALDTEAAAVDALRAVTTVLAARDRPVALLIDEFDGLLTGPPEAVPIKAQALGRLMEVYISTGSLLVLIGRPAAFRLLPAQVAERMGSVIRPTPFTARNAAAYLKLAMGGPGPFTDAGVGHLVERTGGNPRWFIRLCHQAYERAAKHDEPVTPSMVQDLIGTDTPPSNAHHYDRRLEGAAGPDFLGDLRRHQSLISVLGAQVAELAARVERLEGGARDAPGAARGPGAARRDTGGR
ncbi:hypothetical protein [Sphaerisporangium aureirubrum]|uniref:AAA+ ATPase domain-containing protein n=1 Tax=Sphaerisporangium aureirubrum TaxID=1544736 RepID=A0ABW1NPV1_9ACTN